MTDGESRGFDPLREGRDTLFIVRHEDRPYAWRNACPHEQAAPLAWRKNAYLDADRTHIVCSAHGAEFEIASGLCILGPCLGQSLTPLRAAVDPDGILSVWLGAPAGQKP